MPSLYKKLNKKTELFNSNLKKDSAPSLKSTVPTYDLSSPFAKALMLLYIQGSLGITTEARAINRKTADNKKTSNTQSTIDTINKFRHVDNVLKRGVMMNGTQPSNAPPNNSEQTCLVSPLGNSLNYATGHNAISKHSVKRSLPGYHRQEMTTLEPDSGPLIEKVPYEVRFKTDYSVKDVIRALGKAKRPFTSLARDVIPPIHKALNNGEELSPEARQVIDNAASIADTLAALAPNERLKVAVMHGFQLASDAIDNKNITKEMVEESNDILLNLKGAENHNNIFSPKINKPVLGPQVRVLAQKISNKQLKNVKSIKLNNPGLNSEGVHFVDGHRYAKIDGVYYPIMWHGRKQTWAIKITDDTNPFFNVWLNQHPSERTPSYIPISNDFESGISEVDGPAFQDDVLNVDNEDFSPERENFGTTQNELAMKQFKSLKMDLENKFGKLYKFMPSDEEIETSLSELVSSKSQLGIFTSEKFVNELDYKVIENSRWSKPYRVVLDMLNTFENIEGPEEEKVGYLDRLEKSLTELLEERKPNHKLPNLYGSKRVPALIKLLIQVKASKQKITEQHEVKILCKRTPVACNTKINIENINVNPESRVASMGRPNKNYKNGGEMDRFVKEVKKAGITSLFALDDGMAKSGGDALKMKFSQSGINYISERNTWIKDFFKYSDGTQPTSKHIDGIVNLMRNAANGNDGIVAVHCALGDGRSGLVKAAFIMKNAFISGGSVQLGEKSFSVSPSIKNQNPVMSYKLAHDIIQEIRIIHKKAVERPDDIAVLNEYAEYLSKQGDE